MDIDPINLRGELAAFQGCQEISHIYAPKRLMPLVFAVGDNFQGTGYPFLQEQYVSSKNMSTAFLENPVYWEEHIPNELVTIYQSIQTTSSADTAETWQDKIDGMLCPKGCDDWYELVLQMGGKLMNMNQKGWRIHGDLQFGNILVPTNKPETLMLIDWEMSEVMPLGYEFAMLYTFLMDPDGQVDPHLCAAYRQYAPFSKLWKRILSSLIDQLGLSLDEIENMLIFRMGNAWLYQLSKALEYQNRDEPKN